MMNDLEKQQREAVLAEAISWLRTPYHHAGRIKGVGVDCAMLLAEVYHRSGVLPKITPDPYPPDWHLHRDRDRFLEWVNRYGTQTMLPKPGDMALYRYGRASSHGAIIVAWPEIIHAAINVGVLRDLGNAPQLQARLVGFWTLWPEGDE